MPVGGFEAVCGDPSADDTLTASDAALALRAAVGLASCDSCRCDVDYSGAVTATDSSLMLKVSVGEALSLSCPACIASDCGTPTTTLPRPNRPRRLVVTNQGSGSGTVVDGIDGIDCGCDCSNRYPNDTKVQLTATPDADSFFTAWGGAVPAACLDSTEPCILRMRQDRSVTATFLAARLLSVSRAGRAREQSWTTPVRSTAGPIARNEFPTTAWSLFEGTRIAAPTSWDGPVPVHLRHATVPALASCGWGGTAPSSEPSIWAIPWT
jgi:hypothetical protein